MSRVIARVPANVVETTEVHSTCNKCGRGNTKDLTEKPCPSDDCDGHWYKEEITFRHVERAYTLVECDCGEEVFCQGFTSTCACGADYNSSGQLLAPRDQWGEETGESYSDIMSIGYSIDD